MSVSALSRKARTLEEKATPTYTVTFTSDGTTPVPSTSVNSITMTIELKDDEDKEDADYSKIRNAQDVFNANNCTYHATSGLFTWDVQEADTTIIDTDRENRQPEIHAVTIVVTYDTTKKLRHFLDLLVTPRSAV